MLRETELLEDKGFKLSRSSADFMGLASAAASDGTQKVGATVIAAQRGAVDSTIVMRRSWVPGPAN